MKVKQIEETKTLFLDLKNNFIESKIIKLIRSKITKRIMSIKKGKIWGCYEVLEKIY